MDGSRLSAGAVAAVKNVKNPIGLARLVMERTSHIFLAGDGANQFAREMGVEMADDDYFFTKNRYEQLLRACEEGVVQTRSRHVRTCCGSGGRNSGRIQDGFSQPPAITGGSDKKPIGTVGAVACDLNGNLAAATSTGGMTNKKFGRVGDTPLIGAGTYADNATCAVFMHRPWRIFHAWRDGL